MASLNVPGAVNLELTNHCNLKCHFCLNPKPEFRKKGFMTEETLNKFIAGHDNKTSIMICGIGEPTLHHDFCFFLDKLAEKFSSVSLVSNFSSIAEEKLRAIAEKTSKVFISLDYFDEKKYSQDKCGDFKKTLNNIEKLIVYRNRYSSPAVIQINMLMQNGSEKQIEKAVEFFTPMLGADDIVYTRMIKNLAGKVNVSKVSSSLSFLTEFKAGLIRKGIDTGKFVVEDWQKILKLNKPFLEREPCSHLDKYYMVMWDGIVNACCVDFNGTLRMGDVNKSNSEEIWNNEKYTKFREANKQCNYKKYKICTNCEDWFKS